VVKWAKNARDNTRARDGHCLNVGSARIRPCMREEGVTAITAFILT
jgi:hypothetical protein